MSATCTQVAKALLVGSVLAGLVMSPPLARAQNELVIGANGDVGINTDMPQTLLHVQENLTGFPSVFTVENLGSDFAGFRFTTTEGSIDFNKAAGNTFRLNIVDGDSFEFELTPDGDLTIAGSIFTAGSCAGGCDRVFAPDYELPTIEEHAEAMWRNSHLPTVGPTEEGQPINLSDKTERMLNELEKAHIYIDQLNNKLKEVSQRNQEMQVSLLQKIEALNLHTVRAVGSDSERQADCADQRAQSQVAESIGPRFDRELSK